MEDISFRGIQISPPYPNSKKNTSMFVLSRNYNIMCKRKTGCKLSPKCFLN